MSQSSLSLNASPGGTFASPNGPWATYLEHLSKKGNTRAGWLLKRYKQCYWTAEARTYAYPDLPCVQILDIDLDDTVRTWSTITFEELFDPNKQSAEVDRFVKSLHTCEPTVQSRLLILNSEPFVETVDAVADLGPYDWARVYYRIIQDLLLGQILGIEYDMTLEEVHYKLLEQDNAKYLQRDPFIGLGYTYKDMKFYGPTHNKEFVQCIRAYTIGPRDVGGRAIEHNVIQFTGSPYSNDDDVEHLVIDRLFGEMRPSEAPDAKGTEPDSRYRSHLRPPVAEMIAHFLRQGD